MVDRLRSQVAGSVPALDLAGEGAALCRSGQLTQAQFRLVEAKRQLEP